MAYRSGMAELPDDVYERMTSLCSKGDELSAEGRHEDAILRYRAAWALLPEPKLDWDAAHWIQVAIADAHFLAREFAEALEPLKLALLSGGIGNPFVHLRRGQCLLETGDREEAIQELTRAYIGGRRDVFQGQDPKYLETLRGVLKPPGGQDDL